MEIVKKPIKSIALIWKSPKRINQRTLYRPMKYLLHTQVDEVLLLHNVVTAETVLLNEEEKALFEGLPTKYSTSMNELIDHHFVVADEFKEDKSVIQLRALLRKLNPSKRVTGFTILPTTECNARCYYCFESSHKRCTLTEEMCTDVVEYISDKCKNEPIEISWFGGEPLVGNKQISQICSELKERGISYKSSMVSNAYLFDEALIQKAKNDWNLNSVQITLDGTEEVYNRTKAYVYPKDNPFKRVLRNIELLLDNGIAVNIRLNVTDKNYRDLEELIELLSDRFNGRNGFSCYSHAVYEGVGFEPLEYDDFNRKVVDAKTAELDGILMEKGLLGSFAKLPYLRFIHCMADNDSCRVIYPDGKIGMCEDKPSSDGVGDIYHDILDEEMHGRYKESKQIEGCNSCCLYPSCVNLKICPDTGKCTDLRVKWKQKRYTDLLIKLYKKYKSDCKTDFDDGNANDVCGS